MFSYLLIFLAFLPTSWAKVDHLSQDVSLGEKKFSLYFGRRAPLLKQDTNTGKIEFEDQIYYQKYFEPYIFNDTSDYENFFKSEMESNLTCDNESFNESFEDMRYSYRLITISYLLEGLWHMNLIGKNLIQNACDFDFDKWLSSCRPKSTEMKKFTNLLKKHQPKYLESLPEKYSKSDWFSDLNKKNYRYYSHYRIHEECKDGCSVETLKLHFNSACQSDKKLLELLCSEEDEVYGLSEAPMAYRLLLTSNIINTFNKNGKAAGCLRRFSNLMQNKEVNYPVLKNLFTPIKQHLEAQYKERFLQGRVFFYGSGKEFEEKGLTNLHVMEQPLQIAVLTDDLEIPLAPPRVVEVPKKEVVTPKVVKKEEKPVLKKEIVEIRETPKSAFLEASETRISSGIRSVDVDMMKFKYDYVFSLNMIQTLTPRLKKFMTREALQEMKTYDFLGSKEAPMPLLFIKFMIDMQEHTGLFNILNILGSTFYVSNDIDVKYKTSPEKIRLENNNSVVGAWQIVVLKP